MDGVKRVVGIIGAALLSACGAGEPVPALPAAPAGPPPQPDAGAPVAPVDAGPEAAAPTAPAVALEPVAVSADGAAPHVEILFPFAEQRIFIPKAAGYHVRLRVEGVKLAAEGAGVEASLDGERPRRVLDVNATTLADLMPEGRAPSPGAHWLFVAAVDEHGSLVRGNGGSRAPYAALRFWVGNRPSPPPRVEPQVVLFSPEGTYNGAAAADAVRVDFLALPERLGAEKGSARVRVTGVGVNVESRVTSWQPLHVTHLPSGDFDVEVELLNAEGAPVSATGAHARRTVTLNREVASGPAK